MISSTPKLVITPSSNASAFEEALAAAVAQLATASTQSAHTAAPSHAAAPSDLAAPAARPAQRAQGATAPVTRGTSRIDVQLPEVEDDDIDLPPLEEPDDGGHEGCDYEFTTCYDQGTYTAYLFFDTHSGLPEPYYRCPRHFTITMEYLADVIGTATAHMARNPQRFSPTAEQLEDLVLGCILGWSHPADAPQEAVPFPEVPLHRHITHDIVPNEFRRQTEDDTLPDTPLRTGTTPAVLAHINAKLDAYFEQHPHEKFAMQVSSRFMGRSTWVASQHASEEDALDAIDALNVQDDVDAINDYAHQHGIVFQNGRAYPHR